MNNARGSITKIYINETHPVLSTRMPRKEFYLFDRVAKRKNLGRSVFLRVLVRRAIRKSS